MMLIFGLVVAACASLLLMHWLACGVPRSDQAFGGVRLRVPMACDPARSRAQVDRAEIERTGGPLREALTNPPELTIAGCRFERIAPGAYRYRNLAGSAVLILRPLADGRLFEISYAVDARW